MSNFEQKKKMADEALLIANDFLKSNLAKEVFLKDDEVTPKELNGRIQKELQIHMDLNKKFIEILEKEDLPSEVFNSEYKQQMSEAKSKIDDLQKDIPNKLDFPSFGEIYISNRMGKDLVLVYYVNEKYREKLFVSSLLVTDNFKGKNIIVSSRDNFIASETILSNWGIYPEGSYNFVAITNDGQKIKLNIK